MRCSGRIAAAGFLLLGGLAQAGCGRSSVPRPDVLVYLIDALRPDRLGCYGYSRPTSPHLDAFAATAIRFENAWSTSSWTRPAVTSLMTGLHPAAHGVQVMTDRLDPGFETLAERFRAQGYQTFAVTANGMVSAQYGLAQGFDEMIRIRGEEPEKSIGRRAEVVHAAFLDFLDHRRDPVRPLFAYVHVIDPHAPYLPPAEERARLATTVDPAVGSRERLFPLLRRERIAEPGEPAAIAQLYDAEVAYADDQFGRLLGALAERELLERLVVAVTADHGEELGERGGWGHGTSLYEEQLRIPLLLKLPQGKGAGTVRTEPAQILDLFPTLLDAAELEMSPLSQGRRLLETTPRSTPRPIWAKLVSGEAGWGGESVLLGKTKLILHRSPGQAHPAVTLYDLTDDPGETRDLSAGGDELLRPLLRELTRLSRSQAPLGATAAAADQELLEEMRALGYTGGAAPEGAR